MTAKDIDDLPAPGTVLAGKYEVVRVLGTGGMGAVLEATHLRMQQSVALKILLPELRADPETTARFEREARAAAKLSGPNVARILDVDVLPDGSPMMVMEFLRGVELGVELERRGGKLPYREAVGYVLQALHAMDEAHRAGIVHRDLKPANLFLCEQGGRRVVKILDFGISKLAGDSNAKLTQTTTSFGTPLYMSPEQVRSTKLVDGRSDVWSLAVVLHELIAGHPPFNYPTPTAILAAIIADEPDQLSAVVPEVPGPLSDAVLKALRKDPAARFADVRAFAAALAPYRPEGMEIPVFSGPAETPFTTVPGASSETAGAMTTPSATAPGRSPRGVALLGVGVAAAVAAVVAIALLALGGRGTAAPPPPLPARDQPTSTASTKEVTVAPAVTASNAPVQADTASHATSTSDRPRVGKPGSPASPGPTAPTAATQVPLAPTPPPAQPTAQPTVAPQPTPVVPPKPPAPKPPTPTDDPLHL